MQLTGGQFTLSTALAGNDLATFPDFPAEIRAPQGTLFGVSAFQINFGSTEIDTAGDAPDVLVAMNPAALKTNVDALQARRPDHCRHRRVHQAQPREGEIRRQPARGWQPRASGRCWPSTSRALTLEAVKPFGLGNKEALRCKNMWTLGLALWMFDRDRAADHRLAEGQVRQDARAGRCQYRRAQCRPCLWRDGGACRPAQAACISMPAPRRAGPLPHRSPAPKRSRSAWSPARSWPDLPMFFGGYPITPASRDPAPSGAAQGIRRHHLPGRGRDRRDLRRDRRVLCRAAGRHQLVGPRHRAEGRGDGPGDHDRAAAGHRQLAARRAVDRPADQDRAVRSLSGGLWPQRRCADAGDRRALARRRVRLRDRGVPHRGAVHDPGDAADRRLYRQCRRAVEGARSWPATRRSRSSSSKRRTSRDGDRLLPYKRDDKLARALDQARHARA